MYSYINGNYFVEINTKSGTKKYRALRIGEDFNADFPDSIDLKITDKCGIGCPFCHESSTPSGKTGNLADLKRVLGELPKYPIEIALGGGDILECPSLTLPLIEWLKSENKIIAGTFNINSLLQGKSLDFQKIIKSLDNIGISITKLPTMDERNNLCSLISCATTQVFHVILGIIPPDDLREILMGVSPWSDRVLILGYKHFGRGKSMNPLTPDLINEYRDIIWEVSQNKCSLSPGDIKKMKRERAIGFDNLALQQLDLKNHIHPQVWEKLYLGDEFTNTMYIDGVKGEFAPTSRSIERVSWNSIGLIDYFKNNHR
jgi:hypothetical protein